MGATSTRVFIISLDGATFDVLRPLAEQGCLPNLQSLMQQGIAARLESVAPPVTAPAWTSFMTGKHPGKHGIFDFTSFDISSHTWSINNARHIRSKTLWQILSSHGKRTVVLNLPYMYPPAEIKGVTVAGWDAPSSEAVFSYPAEVSEQILARFPDYKSNLWVSEFTPLRSEAQFAEFTQRLKRGFEQQAAIALDLLQKENWDVFMVHFQQTDWIQHKLWTFIEQACRDAADKSANVEATRDCYRRFDELVGVLLRHVEPLQPFIIVLSDHGFGRLQGNIYPNSYLKRWGYLAPTSPQHDRLKPVKDLLRNSRFSRVRAAYRALAAARSNWAERSAKAHQSWADNAGDVLAGRRLSVDWEKTRVVAIWAYQMGFLHVNLAGRDPGGIVQPGQEYEQLLDQLIVKFQDIRHPATGDRLLQAVVRGRELYPGAGDGVLVPDLVLVPVDGYGFSFTMSEAPPEMSEEGSHRHDGVVLLQGQGLMPQPAGFSPNLVDVAPTILHVLGLPVPLDMDGRVWEEVFSRHRPVHFEKVDNSVTAPADGYSQEEAALIEQRLKGLGYLE